MKEKKFWLISCICSILYGIVLVFWGVIIYYSTMNEAGISADYRITMIEIALMLGFFGVGFIVVCLYCFGKYRRLINEE